MTLKEKITKAVNEVRNQAHPFALEQYEDDYDGFTHSTYSGLIDEIEEELESLGYVNPNMSIIRNLTFDLF